MRVGDHKHGKNVFFHATGLSGDNNPSRGTNWKMRTLQKQREELGHSRVCTLRKCLFLGKANCERKLNYQFDTWRIV
jgi:hypothetical protein